MKTSPATEAEIPTDVSLIESSLAGDREAFGKIVVRYQASICGLAYSACGDLVRSEDIAQDVFITAWKNLSRLSDRAKFKSWLYGIARNLINNTLRQHTRNPVSTAEIIEEEVEPGPSGNEPDEQAISREEATILWHVLSGLPQVYRDPMVLFYRQNESVSRVAEVLEISEDAVRQRLARGRSLLNERVAKVVQSGLRRSGPAGTFAIAVVAGLPLLGTAMTAKGAAVGVAAGKSATSQATGTAGFLKGAGFFAGLLAVPAALGSYFGYKLGQDATGRPEQRKSVSKFWRAFGIAMGLLLFLPFLLTICITGFLEGEARARFLAAMTYWLGLAYPMILVLLTVWVCQRRRHQSRTGGVDGLGQSDTDEIPAVPANTVKRLAIFATIAASGLLVFCLLDTNYNVQSLSPDGVHKLINKAAPADLKVSIMQGHAHSLFREYPEIVHRRFWIEVRSDGKITKYTADVDEASLALIKQKGIKCPTYVAGRDYEILGTPGRLLPLVAAFIVAIGGIFLFKRWRAARN